MSAPTRNLLRYLKHLTAKGGEHAALADNANAFMRGATSGSMFEALGKNSDRVNDLTAMAGKSLHRPYEGVSSKQQDHLIESLKTKFKDVDNYEKWAKLGTPGPTEMRGMINTLNDNWADNFKAYKARTGPRDDLWKKLLEQPGQSSDLENLGIWLMKRERGF